jgi:D-sedoheptulose 7-phosphate isomerase
MSRADKNSARRYNGDEEVLPLEGYFQQVAALIPLLPYAAMDRIAQALLQAFEEEKMIFVFGNGGSAASASHMMCDMNKGASDAVLGKRLKVMALTDNVPLLTAWANDSSYDRVFSEQLKNFVRSRDVVLAISASGNSRNVLLALRTAREHGAVTLGISGYQGGAMKPLCDVCAVVPCDNMQIIEDMHHAILHSVFTAVRKRLVAPIPEAVTAAGGRFSR